MDRQDYDILKSSTLDALDKNFSEDRMFIVGHIFAAEGIFQDAYQAIEFCERPDKWRNDMKELIQQYEEDLLWPDCRVMTRDQQQEADAWLYAFNYDEKVIERCLCEVYEYA